MDKKEGSKKIDFVKWFSELNKDSGNVAGGKGANLSEIYNLKIPVPPGFVVTAQAYDYFIETSKIDDKIKELLPSISYEDTKQLNHATEQIRKLITDSKIPEEMEKEIIESYEHLDVNEEHIKNNTALGILNPSSEPIFVAVRSSATTEDLAEASFAGQQDSFLNVKGNDELLKHIKKCFASLFTARATYYRNKQGFKHEEASLAVVVQKMVDSDKSGVIFSKDPAYKNNNIIIESVYGLGEGIVSGKISPDRHIVSEDFKIIEEKIADKKIALTRDSGGQQIEVKLTPQRSTSQVLKNFEIHKLAEFAIRLEDHYKKPQDIEFAIEGENIHIVQTRPITTIDKRIEKTEGKKIEGEVILEGLAASPGIASGKIRIIENLEDLHSLKEGEILVTKMTNPDMVVAMEKSAAIVTDEGGLTAHAAIVSREMGTPAIVGTQVATTKLKEGEIITVDGTNGKIYKGKTSETIKKEIKPVTAKTKTEIKVMVDLPSFAERASKTMLKKVGLVRIEGIIAESGKHPDYFIKQNKIKDYEEVIFQGIDKIANYFEELWVRTSDIRSDEFENLEGAPKEKEANPMLGMHGIRYSLKNPDVLKSELNALKRVAQKNKKIGILLPQIISVEEVKQVKKYIQEIGFSDSKIGVMIETPAAVQLIRDLCIEGIDFISFGTNDLTQYMLAIDRGNTQVQHLYNEMHPAILYQLGYVIRICKKNNVETSICGQAGSKKEMAKFLVENKIDSISVNADVASDIAEYVLEVENSLVKGTDKEPRKYQPEEENKNHAQSTQSKENKEEIIKEVEEQVNIETSDQKEERIQKDVDSIEKEREEYEKNDSVPNHSQNTENNEKKDEPAENESLNIF
jgi:pyruvate, water dikinase